MNYRKEQEDLYKGWGPPKEKPVSKKRQTPMDPEEKNREDYILTVTTRVRYHLNSFQDPALKATAERLRKEGKLTQDKFGYLQPADQPGLVVPKAGEIMVGKGYNPDLAKAARGLKEPPQRKPLETLEGWLVRCAQAGTPADYYKLHPRQREWAQGMINAGVLQLKDDALLVMGDATKGKPGDRDCYLKPNHELMDSCPCGYRRATECTKREDPEAEDMRRAGLVEVKPGTWEPKAMKPGALIPEKAEVERYVQAAATMEVYAPKLQRRAHQVARVVFQASVGRYPETEPETIHIMAHRVDVAWKATEGGSNTGDEISFPTPLLHNHAALESYLDTKSAERERLKKEKAERERAAISEVQEKAKKRSRRAKRGQLTKLLRQAEALKKELGLE